MKHRLHPRLLLVGALILVPAGALVSGPADCVVPQTGTTITRDTVFCPGNHTVSNIAIGADGVVLDLTGSALQSSDDQATCFILDGVHGATINGGELRNYRTAISLHAATGNRIQGVLVETDREGCYYHGPCRRSRDGNLGGKPPALAAGDDAPAEGECPEETPDEETRAIIFADGADENLIEGINVQNYATAVALSRCRANVFRGNTIRFNGTARREC